MRRLSSDVLVVGSGPGGAMSACLLAESGLDVLVVEEGPDLAPGSVPPFSLEEMRLRYRGAGLSPAMGPTSITCIEACCVGGASEVNAALYHRPHPRTLASWSGEHGLPGLDEAALEPHFAFVERAVGTAVHPDGPGPASGAILRGAAELGWAASELPRFWRYERAAGGGWTGHRRSMARSLLPRARAAGARLLAGARIQRFQGRGGVARAALGRAGSERLRIDFGSLFVCAGAVQTPALLRRSGARHMAGDTLRMHPMARVVARFPGPVNDPRYAVPVVQVDSFKPEITLGGSYSSPPHLALWLEGAGRAMAADWPRMGVFYVAVHGLGRGTVRPLPGVDEALVRFRMDPEDRRRLGEGLYRLGQLLFAAGADMVSNPVEGGEPFRQPGQMEPLRSGIDDGRVNVSTIHLFSSCPMSDDPARGAVDAYGRLHGWDNVVLNDGSILPAAPGVNPEGTILALARRNTLRFLERLRRAPGGGPDGEEG